jgi:hypothetical protein
MESEVNTVKCPSCGFDINVSDVLFHQVQEQLKKEYEAKGAAKDKEFSAKEQELQQEKEALLKAQESMLEQVNAAVKQRLFVEKASMEQTLRKQIEDEKSEQVKSLETELNTKSDQLKEFNKTKALVSQLQREKGEIKELVEAEAELKFNDLLSQEREKIKSAESEKNKLDVQKRDKLIADLQKQLEDTQKKLEQGSNKLTGEVTEIELRQFLRTTYPIDDIQDVPSGVKGGDVFQIVKNNIGAPSGTILYERKQTQAFSEGWVSKLKEDGRTAKSDVLVIVTSAMPKDNTETHFRDGVWVCAFDDLPLLTILLRDGLIKQSAALVSQQNSGAKTEMLYQYLLSNDFKNHILGILDAFRKMDKAVSKEKEDTVKRLAEREAHIYQAKHSILSFWGRIEGITTNGLDQQMKMLDEPPQQLES